eukprot:2270657-Prymnesium_polylepis.1
MPSTAGLNEYMASRYTGEDYSSLSDADFKELIDAHNRIVALMAGNDPRSIIDALKLRHAGQNLDMGSAFEAEPEPEPEPEPEGEAKEGEGGAGKPSDGAAAPAVELS